jgi:hypothetical protein
VEDGVSDAEGLLELLKIDFETEPDVLFARFRDRYNSNINP